MQVTAVASAEAWKKVGMLVLIAAGQSPVRWPSLLLASFDQLLPAIKPNKAYEAMIFGDSTAKPPLNPQPDWVLIYFYVQKVIGWVLGSFIVAGLAGLNERPTDQKSADIEMGRIALFTLLPQWASLVLMLAIGVWQPTYL